MIPSHNPLGPPCAQYNNGTTSTVYHPGAQMSWPVNSTIVPSQLTALPPPIPSLPQPLPPTWSQPSGPVTGIASSAGDSGSNLLINAANILAGTTAAPTSHLHQLLSMFLLAAAADSQPIPPAPPSSSSRSTFVSLLDGFETNLRAPPQPVHSSGQAGSTSEPPPPEAVNSFGLPPDWFDLSLNPGSTSERTGNVDVNGGAVLSSGGDWQALSVEDLMSSLHDFDAAGGHSLPVSQSEASNLQNEVSPAPGSQHDSAEHLPRHSSSSSSLQSIQTTSSLSSSRGSYQRLYSDADVDEGMAIPLLSDAQPPAHQVAQEPGEAVQDDEEAETLKFVNGWLHYLQTGYDHDNVIGDCEAALRRLLEESRHTPSPSNA